MRISPTVAIAHLLAIVLGLWGGLSLISRLAPDLAGDDVEPGVSVAADPSVVDGGDSSSLLRAGPLAEALQNLDDQMAAGQGIARMEITPGEINVSTDDAEGRIDPAEIPPEAPERIIEGAAEQQPRIDLEHVRSIALVQTKRGPVWYLQIVSGDSKLPPPWTYHAPLDGSPVTAGGAEPEPVQP